jgi:Ion channel
MTDSTVSEPGGLEQKPPLRVVVWAVLRAVASTVALVAIYYLLPLSHASTGAAITMLTAGLVVFLVLLAAQIRAIARSPFPGLRAVEALAISVPFFLLLFAAVYSVMAQGAAGDFSQPLTRTDALYFTVTTFSTTGFGDITAKTQVARLVVTGQMVADLIIIGIGIRAIVGAVQRGRRRRSAAARAAPASE